MKVTIVTVSYNSGSTIADTFDSVLRQTYSDIEYVVIDGGSTDNTVEIIKSYEPRFEGRMKWVSEKDKGLYDAMNKGIKLSTGDIVGILNSDDFFSTDRIIEQMIAPFESNRELQSVYGDIHFVKSTKLNKQVRYYSSKLFRPSLFRLGFMPAHPSFYVKREVFEKYGYYDLNYYIASDFDLLVRFLYVNKVSSSYIPLDMVTMRVGGRSTASLKNRLILNKEIVRACRKYGIRTNLFIVFLKYFYKVFELRYK